MTKYLGIPGLGVIVDKIKEIFAALKLKVDLASLPIYDFTTSTNSIIDGIKMLSYGPCLIKGFKNVQQGTFIVDKDSYVLLNPGFSQYNPVAAYLGKYSDLEQGSKITAKKIDHSMLGHMVDDIGSKAFIECERAMFLNVCLHNSGICDDFTYDETTKLNEFLDYLDNTNLHNNATTPLRTYLNKDANLTYILTKYAPSEQKTTTSEFPIFEFGKQYNVDNMPTKFAIKGFRLNVYGKEVVEDPNSIVYFKVCDFRSGTWFAYDIMTAYPGILWPGEEACFNILMALQSGDKMTTLPVETENFSY